MINNILKKIEKANEVQKVELEKHEVELALVDDLNKLVVRMKAIDGALMKSVQKTISALTSFSKIQGDLSDGYLTAIADRDDANADIKEALFLIDKISKQAKDLGINPNEIKGTKEIVDLTANIEDTINSLNKNESDVKKILAI